VPVSATVPVVAIINSNHDVVEMLRLSFEQAGFVVVLDGCQFVLTSTNPARAHELAKTSEEVYEVVGKPYDLTQITRAVKEASRARPTR
jgi:hypothetical protein